MFRNFFEKKFTLKTFKDTLEFSHKNILRNPSNKELYEVSTSSYPIDSQTPPTLTTSTGAMAAYTGTKTNLCPMHSKIVKEYNSMNEVCWDINSSISAKSFEQLEETAKNYMKDRPKLYIVDGYSGWDILNRLKIRVYCLRAYHALFIKNMLIRPTEQELTEDFNQIDLTIFNAGEYHSSEVNSEPEIALDFNKKKMVILGSQYAGEMKEGIFRYMNYIMPKRGILSMRASANEGKKGDVSLFFGSGKNTLSNDPNRKLIGDDEHCWSDKGIFNIEGGCYKPCAGLSLENEPEVYKSIKYGSILENIGFSDFQTKVVNYNDTSITDNIRTSYPLSYINNSKIPAIGGHPKNIIFLTFDSYGVLPLISKLNYNQAVYHFISGYSSNLNSMKDPSSIFNNFYSESKLPLHPLIYADLFAEKIQKHKSKVWLINSGLARGKYGDGKGIDLKYTRRIIELIHKDELDNLPTFKMDVFKLEIPEYVNGIPSEIIKPENAWADKVEYIHTLNILAEKFNDNFKRYENKVSKSIRDAGPVFHH